LYPSATSSTRVLALLGDPVAHSLSPVIHNAAFREVDADAVYVALRCAEGELGGVMRTLALSGGGGNVTLPHKERAASLLDVPSEAVIRTGACNTFWGDGEVVRGDNTDVEGFLRALATSGLPATGPGGVGEGSRVLLLGAGGAARAVLAALLDGGAGEIHLRNRSVERARALARRAGDERVRVHAAGEEIGEEKYDLVINATSLGLDPHDPSPLDLEGTAGAGGVFDLVYGTRETRFVQEARAQGIPAVDGREMLVQQAAVAFERWWDGPAPVVVMRGALEGAR
jgi:shikimate dehydrogenase